MAISGGYAEVAGLEELITNMEKELGERKVTTVVNKALTNVAKEVEPELKSAISGFQRTGASVSEVTSSRVSRVGGVPTVRVGFDGAGRHQRWRLVHLNEFGYAHNPSPRGFGAMRRFVDTLEGDYAERVAKEVRGEFGL